MIGRMLIASVVVFALCGLWLLAVQAGRRMAARHPELGCYREEGGGCGKSCRCSSAVPAVKPSEVSSQKSEGDCLDDF